ncbi:MAG: hypothetical protein WAW39_16595 [Prosthecobacter sp.]
MKFPSMILRTLGGFILAAALFSTASAQVGKPNILVIVADDLGSVLKPV